MKTVKLCAPQGGCPEVKVTDTHVEIGEANNTCVLTLEQWESLKGKILAGEL